MRFFINPDVDSNVRFDLTRFMEFTDNLDPLTSSILDDIRELPQQGFFAVQGEEFRPDSVSHKVYGTHQYWWVIMAYNDIADVNKLTSGTVLKYPSLADLEDIYFTLKSKQTAQGT
jgi:hypothetical protein